MRYVLATFFYADDLGLLAPSAIAVQELLDICHEYGVDSLSSTMSFTIH